MAKLSLEPMSPPVELQQLDPSPMDEYPPNGSDKDYFPRTSSSAAPGHSSTLGLGAHKPPYYRAI